MYIKVYRLGRRKNGSTDSSRENVVKSFEKNVSCERKLGKIALKMVLSHSSLTTISIAIIKGSIFPSLFFSKKRSDREKFC